MLSFVNCTFNQEAARSIVGKSVHFLEECFIGSEDFQDFFQAKYLTISQKNICSLEQLGVHENQHGQGNSNHVLKFVFVSNGSNDK